MEEKKLRKINKRKGVLMIVLSIVMLMSLSVSHVYASDPEPLVTYEFGSDNFAASVGLTGGTVYTGFDAISVYTVSASGNAVISVPVNFNSAVTGLAIEYANNMTSIVADNLTITLHSGETSYSLTAGAAYYELSDGILTSKTAGTNGVLNAAQNTYECFYGHLVLDISAFALPAETTIDTIDFTTQLTAPARYNIGRVHTMSALTVEGIGNAIYTPAVDNFVLGGNTENYAAQFLSQNDVKYYEAANGDTTDPIWVKFPDEILNTSETTVANTFGVYEYANLSGLSAIVMDVDASMSEADIRLGMSLFSGDGTNIWNAQRFQPVEFICVGDNGAVYNLSGHDGSVWISDGRPYMPAGFKGKVYIMLDTIVARTSTNIFNYSNVFPYIKVYAAPVNNAGAVMNVSSIYLTNEIIDVQSYPVVVTTISNRGTITVDKPNVIPGSSVTVTVTANAGYVISQVTVDGTEITLSSEGTYTIENVQARTEVAATFIPDPNAEPRYIIIVPNDYATITPDKSPVPNGAEVTFTVTPQLGYEIVSFLINDVEVELINNQYTMTEVDADIKAEVQTAAILDYTAPLDGTGNIIMDGKQEFGSVYADFNSIFVSGKFNAPIKDGQAPLVGLKLKNLLVNDFSAKDALVIQYRALSTSVSTYAECGVKIGIFDDTLGMATQAGKDFYISEDGTITKGSNISGGMVFTGKPDFSGYLILPINTVFAKAFELNTEEGTLNTTNIQSILMYDDYRWWSDFLAKYFIGEVYLANFDTEAKIMSNSTLIWTPQEAVEDVDYELFYQDALGLTPDGKTKDDYATLNTVTAGEILFKDFSGYGFTNEKSSLRIKVDDRMLNNEGFAVWSNIDAIRISVDNSANNFAIPYSLGVRPWNSTADIDEWIMTGLGGVIFVPEVGTASYATTNTTIIPANFKGYIYIPVNEIVFAARDSQEAEFPIEAQDYIVLYLPVVDSTIIDGSKIILNEVLFASENSEIAYTAAAFDCPIAYVLDGGTNAVNNPATYNITSEIVLADAIKESYGFEGWFLNPEFKGRAITEINAGTHGNMTLYAKFAAYLTVTYDISEGGSVTPNIPTLSVGASQTFIVTANDGYEIEYVFVNDESVALTSGMFELTDVQENITIKVSFKELETEPPVPAKKGCFSAIGSFSAMAGLITMLAVSLTFKKKK